MAASLTAQQCAGKGAGGTLVCIGGLQCILPSLPSKGFVGLAVGQKALACAIMDIITVIIAIGFQYWLSYAAGMEHGQAGWGAWPGEHGQAGWGAW
eukprot:9494835-Pyramimonas_sp.AAC.1